MRLIDADELKKCAIPCEIHNGSLTDLCVPLYQIDNAPTVEIPTELCKGCRFLKDCETCEEKLRPQGKWINHRTIIHDGEYYCSNCDEVAEWLDGGSQFLSKFCPNCGADMKGGAE